MKVRELQVRSGGYLSRAPAAPPQSSCAGPLPVGGLPGPGGTSQAGWHLQAQSWSAEIWVLLQPKSTQSCWVNNCATAWSEFPENGYVCGLQLIRLASS